MEDNIEVAIRVRPVLIKEFNEGLPVHWQIQDENIFQIDAQGKPLSQSFKFDHIFAGDKSNNDIFEAVVQPMIKSAMAGYNATVFAYGQTASGKTYTMLGREDDPGMIPLTIENIFEIINNNPERKFLLRLSYIEIYNDVIYDLLGTVTKAIKIREDFQGAIHLNVNEKIIHSTGEAHLIIKEGDKRRRCGTTGMNQKSSRSHTIFRIIIESTPLNDDPESDLPVQVSHLNLVDLAGSERVAQTKATGTRLREGGQINKSLHHLSLVIRQLSEGKDFTNFRDSKLTRILKESLGGNAKTLIIGAITPTSIEDSQSTLNFAYQAKKIKNKPTINEVLTSEALTKQYIQKEKQLRMQLEEMAKDKKALEEKHIRTVNDLNDKLNYCSHQFIISNNSFPVKEEEKRRHTMGASLQKIGNHKEYFNSRFKCATVQQQPRVRKKPLISSSSESVPSGSDSKRLCLGVTTNQESQQLEDVDTPSQHIAAVTTNQELQQVEDVQKPAQQIAIDNSKSQDEEKKGKRAEMRRQYLITQKKVDELEPILKKIVACSDDYSDDDELFSSTTSLSNDLKEDDDTENIGTSIKTKTAKVEYDYQAANEIFDDMLLTDLVRDNQNLEKQIVEITQKLKIAEQTNAALKLKLEEKSKTLEKTEDELLSVNEQLDHEENEKNKLRQLLAEMNSGRSELASILNVNHNMTNEEQLAPIKSEPADIIEDEDPENEDPEDEDTEEEDIKDEDIKDEDAEEEDIKDEDTEDEHIEEQHNLMTDSFQNKFESVQPEPSLLENQFHKLDDVTNLLNNLKILLCSDNDQVIFTTEEQERIITAVQSTFDDENNKQSGYKESYEELECRVQELKEVIFSYTDTILTINKEIMEKREIIAEKDKSVKDLELQLHHCRIEEEKQSDLLKQQRQVFALKTAKQQKCLVNVLTVNNKLGNKVTKLEVANSKLTKQLTVAEDGTKTNHKLTEAKSLLEQQLTQQQLLIDKLNEEKRLIENNVVQQEPTMDNLIEENRILKNKLLEQEQLNDELTKKCKLESAIILPESGYVMLSEDDEVLKEELIQEQQFCDKLAQEKYMLENKNIQLTEENNLLQNKLTQQEQLNAKFAEETHLLEDNLTKHVQENAELTENKKILEDKLAQEKELNAKCAEEKHLLDSNLTKCVQENAELIKEKKILEDKLVQEEELNVKAIEEKHLFEDNLAKCVQENAELIKEKKLLEDKLIREKELNVKAIEEKHLFEDNLTKCLQENAELIKEKQILEKKLTQEEQLNAKLTQEKRLLQDDVYIFKNTQLGKETNALQNQLAQQEQLNIKLKEENCSLKEIITKMELTTTELHKENNMLQDNLTEKEQSNIKLTEENRLVNEVITTLKIAKAQLFEEKAKRASEKCLLDIISTQREEAIKLIEERNMFENKLAHQKLLEVQIAEENQTLQNNVSKQEQANVKLSRENVALHNKLVHQKQMNNELAEKNQRLLADKVTCSKQEEEREKLVEDVLRDKLTKQIEINAILVKEKDVLKDSVIKRKQFNVKLIETVTALQQINAELKGKNAQQAEVLLENFKLVEENKMLRDKNIEQGRAIVELTKQVNLYLKQSADLARLNQTCKTLNISPTRDCKPNSTESSSSSANTEDCHNEWHFNVIRLQNIMKSKDDEIKGLDKEITEAVILVRHLEKVVVDQTKEISKLKSELMDQLKSHQISITDFKKRRSNAQDSSRNLSEEEEESVMCSSCKATDQILLNRALLREIPRKNMEIAKLQKDLENLQMDSMCRVDGGEHEKLIEEYEKLKVKYKQVRKVAVMRRTELKNYLFPKVDCGTQTLSSS